MSGGNQIGTALTQDNLTVTDGLFTTELDFGLRHLPGKIVTWRLASGSEVVQAVTKRWPHARRYGQPLMRFMLLLLAKPNSNILRNLPLSQQMVPTIGNPSLLAMIPFSQWQIIGMEQHTTSTQKYIAGTELHLPSFNQFLPTETI